MKKLFELGLICALATLGAYLAGQFLPLGDTVQPLLRELSQAGAPWPLQSLIWVLAMALPAGLAGGFLLSMVARPLGGIGFGRLLLAALVSIMVLQPEQVQSVLAEVAEYPLSGALLGVDVLVRALLYRRFCRRASAPRRKASAPLPERAAQTLARSQAAKPARSKAGWQEPAARSETVASRGAGRRTPPRTLQRPRGWAIEKVRQTGPVGIERSWRGR